MSLDKLYSYQNIAAIVVIIGIIIEELPQVRNAFKLRKIFVTDGRQAGWAKVRKHRIKIVESVGFVLLIVGLASELLFQSKIETENNRLAAIAADKIAYLETPRSLSNAQETAITSAVKPFQGTIYEVSCPNDPEPEDVALQIEGALNAAGWHPRNWSGSTAMVIPHSVNFGISNGKSVEITRPSGMDKELFPASKALATALTDAGIKAISVLALPSAAISPDAITVSVGVKPPPK